MCRKAIFEVFDVFLLSTSFIGISDNRDNFHGPEPPLLFDVYCSSRIYIRDLSATVACYTIEINWCDTNLNHAVLTYIEQLLFANYTSSSKVHYCRDPLGVVVGQCKETKWRCLSAVVSVPFLSAMGLVLVTAEVGEMYVGLVTLITQLQKENRP